MKRSDRELGMNRAISRRDVIHGVGVAGVSLALPGLLSACDGTPKATAGAYPPAATGLRGNHDGAFDVAHQLGREGRTDWGPVIEPESVVYDLVVVGGGLSGLAAAHFYRRDHADARILILDNHDDFGGHAKRNEIDFDGRMLLGHGGSQTLVAPSSYSRVVKGLLDDLGVDISRFDTAYDQSIFNRHGLETGIHFNEEKWGVNRTVPLKFGWYSDYTDTEASLSPAETVALFPISEAAQLEFLHLLTVADDQMPEIPADEKTAYLSGISYQTFLQRHLNITEPQVFEVLRDLAGDYGHGIEGTTAYKVLSYANLPGWEAAGLPDGEEDEAYIHHFPDGNASIARLLVRAMIPGVAPGHTMEDIVTARFDYAKLDQHDQNVRIRLNATVTHVEHVGAVTDARDMAITYVQADQAYRVKARGCVLACNNSIIPYLCPDLPAAQREALAYQVKQPLFYTTVALRNWRAWKKMGIAVVASPGSYHTWVQLDFPVSLGDYTYSGGPDEPVIVHMERIPQAVDQGLTPQEHYRMARHELIMTPFEDIERNIRDQLASLLGDAGFDPAEDIAGITVNRWAHGYAYSYNPLYETTYDDWEDARYPHMQARKPFGRITIANADSDANAMFESAVEQAHRAVAELPGP